MQRIEQGEVAGEKNTGRVCAPAAAGPASPALVLLVFLVFYLGYLTVSTVKRNSIYENTVTLWRTVVESTPDKRRSHQNYANALVSLGSRNGDARFYWEALRELQAVLSVPDDGSVDMRNVLGAIGMVYYQLDMVDEAIRVWKEGLDRFPLDTALESDVAFALVRQRKFDEALGYALAASNGDPMIPEAANTLGLIYLEKGEYRNAAEQFVRFQELRPEEATGYWNAALAFEKAGNYLMAHEMITRFLAREPDPERRATARSFIENMKTGGQKPSK